MVRYGMPMVNYDITNHRQKELSFEDIWAQLSPSKRKGKKLSTLVPYFLLLCFCFFLVFCSFLFVIFILRSSCLSSFISTPGYFFVILFSVCDLHSLIFMLESLLISTAPYFFFYSFFLFAIFILRSSCLFLFISTGAYFFCYSFVA
ncbi:hypothetical protein M514_15195 [Trichuris suis]|uniref:Uncharacterized protein n=1 Tax=Trichuris suis TaxID=68888 RepID=A0A085NTJ5_9BILA|nr:hypothetical protein M514_15195 [Trichuris suis]